jgi:hypothetical protein
MDKLEVPLLVSVTFLPLLDVPVCWVVNARLAGENVTVCVTVPVPLPLRATSSGLSAALSVRVSAPVMVPETVGVKVTFTVQVPPAAMEPEQVLLDME